MQTYLSNYQICLRGFVDSPQCKDSLVRWNHLWGILLRGYGKIVYYLLLVLYLALRMGIK